MRNYFIKIIIVNIIVLNTNKKQSYSITYQQSTITSYMSLGHPDGGG